MTVSFPRGSALILRVASSPSMTGICTSIRINRGFHSSQLRMAASPLSAPCTEKPTERQQLHQPVPVLKLIVDDQDSGSFRPGSDADDAARSAPLDGYSGVATLDRDLEPEYGARARRCW